jgi:hypothetical protein
MMGVRQLSAVAVLHLRMPHMELHTDAEVNLSPGAANPSAIALLVMLRMRCFTLPCGYTSSRWPKGTLLLYGKVNMGKNSLGSL